MDTGFKTRGLHHFCFGTNAPLAVRERLLHIGFIIHSIPIQSFAIGAIIHFDSGEGVGIEKEHRIGHGIGR